MAASEHQFELIKGMELMNLKLNLKRGLVRLWIALSLAWVIYAGLLSISKLGRYPEHSPVNAAIVAESIRAGFAYQDGNMTKTVCNEYAAKVSRGELMYSGFVDCDNLKQPSKSPLLDLTTKTLYVPHCSGGYGQSGGDKAVSVNDCSVSVYIDSDPQAVMDAIADSESVYTYEYWHNHVLKAVFFTFSPPIVAWLIGYLLVWVGKGFMSA
jgi:hypothetical protein